MLLSCSGCEGFVPKNASVCPHCGAQSLDIKANSKFGGMARNLATVATGGAIAVTLMACYGGPPRTGFDLPPTNPDCSAGPLPNVDDPLGDNIDQNCDGVDGVASDAGASCATCVSAVQATGFATPAAPFCSAQDQTAFDALQLCVCSPKCSDACGPNVCAGKPPTADCSTCVMAQCNTENLACTDN